jgi:hypothetical protein
LTAEGLIVALGIAASLLWLALTAKARDSLRPRNQSRKF